MWNRTFNIEQWKHKNALNQRKLQSYKRVMMIKTKQNKTHCASY